MEQLLRFQSAESQRSPVLALFTGTLACLMLFNESRLRGVIGRAKVTAKRSHSTSQGCCNLSALESVLEEQHEGPALNERAIEYEIAESISRVL